MGISMDMAMDTTMAMDSYGYGYGYGYGKVRYDLLWHGTPRYRMAWYGRESEYRLCSVEICSVPLGMLRLEFPGLQGSCQGVGVGVGVGIRN